MIAFLSPGQGSQRPGILQPWLTDSASRELIEQFNTIADFDLIDAGTTWDSPELRDTRIAQPLLFSASFVSAATALRHGLVPQLVAGHSVGEWTAAALAGVFTASEAMQLVCVRANAMADSCATTPTAMAAVLGGDAQEVENSVKSLGLSAANNNGVGQVVVGGPTESVEEFAANPPAGARVRVLGVAGAFHTEYMRDAVPVVSDAASQVAVADARVGLVSNLDGQIVHSGEVIRERLVRQIAEPVRWDLCMATLLSEQVTTTLETCPAGTLTGMGKRNMAGVVGLRVDTPAAFQTAELAGLQAGSVA